MRVLQVIARMNTGGTARYLDVLTSGLNAAGVDTLLATGHVQGHEAEDACVSALPHTRIAHLGRRIDPRQDVRARRELAELIESFQPDVIHTHTFKAGALGRTVGRGIPHVHTFHGNSPADPEFQGIKGRVLTQIERALAPRTNALVSISHHIATELSTAGIAPRDTFHVIASGVRSLDLPAQDAARLRLGISHAGLVVGWLGRLIPVKAPERVLALAQQFPEVTFVLAGEGPLREMLLREAPSNVVLPGWVDASDVLAASDIMLMTSLSEGMPVALVESQLAGKPVVATRVGGIPEALEDGVTGFLVEADGLGRALSELLSDSDLRERMGRAGQTRAQRIFSPEAMVTAHIELYRQVLDAHHGR